MWIWIANKFAKFHAKKTTNLQNFMQKRLNQSANITKSFGGATFFWNTLYVKDKNEDFMIKLKEFYVLTGFHLFRE